MIYSSWLNCRTCFRTVNFPFRIFFVMFFVQTFKIIVTNYINFLSTILSAICHHIIWTNCNQSVFIRVMMFNNFFKFFCYFETVSYMSIINFVSNRPHYQARMISVFSHPAYSIFFKPFIKIISVIKRCFWFFPHIKSFVIYQNSHFIG